MKKALLFSLFVCFGAVSASALPLQVTKGKPAADLYRALSSTVGVDFGTITAESLSCELSPTGFVFAQCEGTIIVNGDAVDIHPIELPASKIFNALVGVGIRARGPESGLYQIVSAYRVFCDYRSSEATCRIVE